MNYLAHAYLSFENDEILLGNMISDFVKGKQQFLYPVIVQKGIVLHRMIDTFTDNHDATLEAKAVFREAYRLYAGAFVDVVYDHFLATDIHEFPGQSLYDFSLRTYQKLSPQEGLMPEKFRKMFYYMKLQNWLWGYSTREGINHSFGGLVRRALYMDDSSPAIKIFAAHYELLGQCYRQFWRDLKPFVILNLNELLSDKK